MRSSWISHWISCHSFVERKPLPWIGAVGGRGVVDPQLADVAFPVEDQLAAMEVQPQVRGVGFADDADHHGRASDEWHDGRRHDPIHRGAGDVEPVEVRVMTQPWCGTRRWMRFSATVAPFR